MSAERRGTLLLKAALLDGKGTGKEVMNYMSEVNGVDSEQMKFANGEIDNERLYKFA